MQKEEREKEGREGKEEGKEGRRRREAGREEERKEEKWAIGNFWQETYRCSYRHSWRVTSSCSRCNRKDIITQHRPHSLNRQ